MAISLLRKLITNFIKQGFLAKIIFCSLRFHSIQVHVKYVNQYVCVFKKCPDIMDYSALGVGQLYELYA